MSKETNCDTLTTDIVDSDVEIVREILMILHRNNMTVGRVRNILKKAMRVSNMVPFQWSEEMELVFQKEFERLQREMAFGF